MIARARFSDAEGQKRAREAWEKHQALVSCAGGICEYLKGALPPENKVTTLVTCGKAPTAEQKGPIFVHVTPR